MDIVLSLHSIFIRLLFASGGSHAFCCHSSVCAKRRMYVKSFKSKGGNEQAHSHTTYRFYISLQHFSFVFFFLLRSPLPALLSELCALGTTHSLWNPRRKLLRWLVSWMSFHSNYTLVVRISWKSAHFEQHGIFSCLCSLSWLYWLQVFCVYGFDMTENVCHLMGKLSRNYHNIAISHGCETNKL